MPQERESLVRDLARETWQSWVDMPHWSQVVLVAGILVHLFFALGPDVRLPHAVLAAIRTAAFVAIVVGLVENAKTLDEFYARVYLDACAFSVVVSSVLLYAAFAFDVQLGARAATVIGATFLIGFVVAFARLRRA